MDGSWTCESSSVSPGFFISRLVFHKAVSDWGDWWGAAKVVGGQGEPHYVTWKAMILSAFFLRITWEGWTGKCWEEKLQIQRSSIQSECFEGLRPQTLPLFFFSSFTTPSTSTDLHISSAVERRWWTAKTELILISRTWERQFISVRSCAFLATPPELLGNFFSPKSWSVTWKHL